MACPTAAHDSSFFNSGVPTMEASSTTTTVERSTSSWSSSMSASALATVRPRSPAPSRMASSTALPVGASTSTSLCAWCAAARSALSECVLPAPAGACSGCTKNGDTAMLRMARA